MFESMSDDKLRALMNAAGPDYAPAISMTEQRAVLNASLNAIMAENFTPYISDVVTNGINTGTQFVLEAMLPNKLDNAVQIIDFASDLRSDGPQVRPSVGVWCDRLGCYAN